MLSILTRLRFAPCSLVAACRRVTLCNPTSAIVLGLGIGTATALPPSPLHGEDLLPASIYSNTAVVVRIDTSKVTLADSLRSQQGSPSPFGMELDWFRKWTQQGVVWGAIDLSSQTGKPELRWVVRDQGNPTRDALRERHHLSQDIQWEADHGFLNIDFADPVKKLMLPTTSDANHRKQLESALKAVESHPVQWAIAIPSSLRRTIQEMNPKLPGPWSSISLGAIAKDMEWIAVGMDLEKLSASIVFKTPNAASANNLQELIKQVVPLAQTHAKQSNWSPLLQVVDSLFREPANWNEKQSTLTFTWQPKPEHRAATSAILAEMLQQQADVKIVNNLKLVALACHNFESAFGHFPPPKSLDPQGKPLLSWRVHLLPFLGQNELYQQFKLNEPWDSDHNKKLIEKIPDIFKPYNALAPQDPACPHGNTTLLAPVGEDTIFGQAKTIGFSQITDGCSNTIWLVVVKPSHSVPWTSPQDYAFEPNDPVRGLDTSRNGTFFASMADGSVSRMPAKMSSENLLYLFRRSDGHVVSFE